MVGDWETRERCITAGLEAGIDWVPVDEADIERVRELGDVSTAMFRTDVSVHVMEAEEDDGESAVLVDAYIISKDSEGDTAVGLPSNFSGSAGLTTLRRDDNLVNGSYARTLSKDYEVFAEETARDGDYAIVIDEDWTITPLEDLIIRIGKETDLVVGVTTAEEARTALEALELGSDDIPFDSNDPDEIRKTVKACDETERESLDLVWAEVTEVERTGMVDRVCVDTGTVMDRDEGVSVGLMARGLSFIRAKTTKSPYVASRSFRVNAGMVHVYTRAPDGDTAYFLELESGSEVQFIDMDGSTREAIIGRVRTERRPIFHISADYEGDRVTALSQNVETIKVHTREGQTAVTDLEPGDKMFIYYEDTARHFGGAIEESIIEK